MKLKVARKYDRHKSDQLSLVDSLLLNINVQPSIIIVKPIRCLLSDK